MILSSVIIILREVLEAALLISLLLSLSNRMGLSKVWIAASSTMGLLGAMAFALFIGPISNLFDGTGQEIVNAGLHSLICVMLAVTIYFWLAQAGQTKIMWTMATAVFAAIVREGSEVWIYYSGFVGNTDLFSSTLLGGVIGLSIGVSTGALLYYGISQLSLRGNYWVNLILLAVVAAGMSSQAINALMQADYVPSTMIMWNSSGVVSENSVVGQLLYALVGYEATPTSLQVGGYILVLVSFGLIGWFKREPLLR